MRSISDSLLKAQRVEPSEFFASVDCFETKQRSQDLVNLDTYREWILLGYLVCPGELLRDRAVDIAMVSCWGQCKICSIY